MAYDIGTARGVIEMSYNGRGVQQAQADLGNLEGKGSKIAGAIGKLGIALGGIGIAAAFGAAINTMAEFEHQLSAIQAVSGATGPELDQIREKALQLGADTAFSASEAAGAMEELVKAGLTVDEVLNGAADAAVNLAAAGGIDIPQAATIAANAMNQFNLKAEDLEGVVDTIAGAANASAIDVLELGQSMQQAGAVANLAGLSFDDAATAIALMGNAGIKGSDAGTSLKTMLQNLQPVTTKQKDLFEELGLVTEDGSNKFFDAEGNVRSYAGIAGVLQKALKGQTNQQKLANLETLFGTDAIRAAAIAADVGAKGVRDLNKEMHETTAAEVAAQRMDNFKGSMDELMGSIETAIITGGSGLLPVLRTIVDGLTDLVNGAVVAGGELSDRLAPGMDSLISAGDSVIDIVGNLIDIFDGLGGALGRLALGTVIATFNALADVLEFVAGAIEGHEDVLLIALGTYLLLANGGVVVLATKLGWLAASALVKALSGMEALDAAVRGADTSMKALAATALIAAANMAAVAVIVAGVQAWNAYSDAVDEVGEAIDNATKGVDESETFTGVQEQVDALADKIAENKDFIDEQRPDLTSWQGLGNTIGDLGNPFDTSQEKAMGFRLEMDELESAAASAQDTLISSADAFLLLAQNLGSIDADSAERLMTMLQEGDPAAVEALDAALVGIQPLLDEAGISAQAFMAALRGEGDLSMGEIQAALQRVTGQANSAKGGMVSLSEAARNFGNDAATAAEKADALKTALDNLIGVEIGAEEAGIAWRDALRQITAELNNTEKAMFGNTKAGDANKELIIGATSSLLDRIEAEAKAGTSLKDLSAIFKTGYDQIVQSAVDAGAKLPEITQFLEDLNFSPKAVRVIVEAVGAERAQSQIEKLTKAADLTPEEVKTLFEATGADTSREKIKALRDEIRRLEGKDAPIDTPGAEDGEKSIKDLRDEIKRLQGKEAPIGTPGAEAAASIVRNLREQIALLRDKTVTITYHTVRTGAGAPEGGQNFPAGLGDPSRALIDTGVLDGHSPIELPQELPRPRLAQRGTRTGRARIVSGELSLDPSGRAYIRGIAEDADDDSDDYADTLGRMGRR